MADDRRERAVFGLNVQRCPRVDAYRRTARVLVRSRLFVLETLPGERLRAVARHQAPAFAVALTAVTPLIIPAISASFAFSSACSRS